jgi:hypothetical protein
MAKAKLARDKALAEQQEKAVTAIGEPLVTGGGSLMNVDLSVDRLYPSAPSNNRAVLSKDSPAWDSSLGSPSFGQLPTGHTVSDLVAPMHPLQPVPLENTEIDMYSVPATNLAEPWVTSTIPDDLALAGVNSMDDGSQLNWENWDDMVQEFGMTYGNGQDQMPPSIFGSGANWY